ncbi:Protein NHR-36 [Aphelenchoides avenae]|nr:Protein NHR-36 [Aphelenchus avenae]
MNAVAVKLPPNADIEGILHAMSNRRDELIAGSVKPFRFSCVAHGVADSRELESLIYVEARCMQLREPCDPMPLYSIGLRENIQATVQLGKIERFSVASEIPSDPCSASSPTSEPLDSKPVHSNRFWLGTDLLLLVEMAKTLPLFETLSTDDKMFILKEVSLAGFMLERIFASVNRQLPSIQMADESRRTSLMTKTGLESEVYVRPLEPFGRVQITMEEFVLVKSLVYTSAGSNDLSPHAKELLASERERYAQILLRHLQRSHGSLDGARRYAEVISLVDVCFHFAQKFREHCIMLSLINTKVTPVFALSTEIFRWK